MMSTQKILITACCAGVLALGLAACGSSSDDDGMPAMTTGNGNGNGNDDGTTMPPVSVSLPPNLPGGHEPAAGMVTIAAGSSEPLGGVKFSCDADGDDCAVTIGDGGSVTSTGGTVTASLTKEAMDVIAAAAGKMTAQSLGLSAALGAEDFGVASDDGGFSPAMPGLMIKRGESGPTAITKTGWAVSDAPHAVTGWHGNKLTKQLTSKHELMVAYTDIDPPNREEFADVWPAGTDPVNMDGDVTITVEDANDVAGHGAHLDKSRFPQAKGPGGGDTTWTYGNDPSTDKHIAFFSGKFQGAQGMYRCAGVGDAGDCSVTVKDSARGGGYTSEGTWTFIPDSTATVVVQDGDYMHFGFWKEVPEKANTAGDYVFQLRLFAGGSMAFDTSNTNVETLEGTVEYKGPAVGIYTTKTIANGEIDSANYGVFAADAKLTAAFGNATEIGDLKGEIMNFRGGDGMDDWSVTLSSAEITTTGVGNGMTTGKMGTENGTGSWDASFFGPSGDEAGTPAPSGVAGTFNANFSAAMIAGSYGAQRQD